MRTVFIAVAVALVAAVPAAAKPGIGVPLTGEALHADHPELTSYACGDGIELTYRASGQASGPYPGRFVETGRLDGTHFEATFTIKSHGVRVTGTKTADLGVTCSQAEPSAAFGGTGSYEATIRVGGRRFVDSGSFDVLAYLCECPELRGFDEQFTSTAG